MDNASTSFPKPEAVYRAVDSALREAGGNPGRSGHRMSLEADRIVYEAREAVAELIGARESKNVIFTSSATESLNLALKGMLKPGDHVISSSIEHNSVTRPLHTLEKKGVEITRINCDPNGFLSCDEIKKAIRSNTALAVLTHSSNVIGALEPAADIGQLLDGAGIPYLLDASQTAGTVPINVNDFKVDLLAAPGHKGLLGPQGTGILYIASHLAPAPLKEGGTGSGSSSREQPAAVPDRYESGTLNTPGIAGLGAGVKFILEEGIEKIRTKEEALLGRLLEGLKGIKEIEIYGPADVEMRASLLSFNIRGMDPSVVSFTLDEDYGIMTRAGLHCAPDAHRQLGTYPEGAVRISPGYYNTFDEIDGVISAVSRIARG